VNNKLEKLANDLAQLAATRRLQKLQTKQAAFDVSQLLSSPTARYALGGLGGAGLGALIGALQPKNKKRNSLYYGAMGGLGGLGLAAALAPSESAKTPASAAANKTDKPKTEPKADSAAKAERPVAPTTGAVAAHLPAALTRPVKSDAVPAAGTGQVALDVPIRMGEAAQKLPGMAGVSPLVQAGGGAAGLYGAIRGTRGVADRFIAGGNRRNTGALAREATRAANQLAWAENHNREMAGIARVQGDADAALLRAQLGRLASQQALNAAREKPIAAAQAAAKKLVESTQSDNATIGARVANSNARRSWRARSLWPQLLRIAAMGGGTYAGATAPNSYSAINDAWNESK